MRRIERATRGLFRHVRAVYSPIQAAKLRWEREAVAWESKGVPQSVLRHTAILVPDTGAVYLAVAKAANTSVKKLIEVPSRAKTGHPNVIPIVKFGLSISDLAQGIRPIFTIVRHPVDRFWSAFAHKIVGKPDFGLTALIRNKLGLDETAYITPDHVLTYIETEPTIDIDEHFMPQMSATAARHLPISFIGHVESLQADIERIVQSGYLPKNSAANLGIFNRSSVDFVYRDEKLRPRISRFYEGDFDTFGYCR
jgi:hypothetical protein